MKRAGRRLRAEAAEVAGRCARRRRRRDGPLPAASSGGADMDEAVGDLKQALPCVAEAPTVHVEVHQRSGR